MAAKALYARRFGTRVLCLTYAVAMLSVLIWGFIAGQSEAAAACTTPPKALACDTTLVDTIQTPTELDCFTFNVPNISSGTRINIRILKDSTIGGSIDPYWRVVTAQNSAVDGCGNFATGFERDCGPLASSGNPHRVEVQDFQNNATGTYRIYLQYLTVGTTCESTPIVCDTPVNRQGKAPLDTDLFAFNVIEGERVHIKVANLTTPGVNPPSRRLLTGTGAPAPSTTCGGYGSQPERDCGPLPASGNPYHIQIKDS
jgi:hypothetical protein